MKQETQMHKENAPKKIKLQSMYPYTFVRVTVMRSKLLQKHDYDKLLKMQFPEIAKFLQDSEYKAEIDEAAFKYSGAELLEIALARNLAKTSSKLRMISSPELNMLIDAYLMKYDLLNIKTIIRGTYTNTDKDYIRKLLVPAGTFDMQFLDEMLKKHSIEEVAKSIPFMDYRSLAPYVGGIKDRGNLFELENALDRFHFTFLIGFSEKIPQEGDLFKEFLLTQIHITNILTIIRLKKEGISKEDIRKFIFMTGHRENDHDTAKMLDAKNIEHLAENITNRKIRKFLERCIEKYKETGSSIEFERQLAKYMLEKAMLLVHQHPLSIDVILGYMLAKEIEVLNLMKIVKGKELGLSEDMISKEIVYQNSDSLHANER